MPGTIAPTSVAGISKTVQRYFPNPADTGDQSFSDGVDTEVGSGAVNGDGFEDGFEYDWDKWQQAHQSNLIVNVTNYWPEITNTVPLWPSERRFNPGKLHVDPDATLNGAPDYDRWYDENNAGEGAYFSDAQEAHASDFANTAGKPYPVVRRFPPPNNPPWATNPFLWDTDGDGMPDGWEVAHGLNPLVNDANGDRDGDGVTNLQEYLNWKALHSGPGLPTGFQLVLRCSDNQYFGVRTATWEILPVVGP